MRTQPIFALVSSGQQVADFAVAHGLEGALYPVRFALNEARVFKHYNFEWFPAYSQAFRFTPEVLAFWTLAVSALPGSPASWATCSAASVAPSGARSPASSPVVRRVRSVARSAAR